VIRNNAGNVGVAAAQDVFVDFNYLKFGVDLIVSRRGTQRQVPKAS
jgi:hypothetical protein